MGYFPSSLPMHHFHARTKTPQYLPEVGLAQIEMATPERVDAGLTWNGTTHTLTVTKAGLYHVSAGLLSAYDFNYYWPIYSLLIKRNFDGINCGPANVLAAQDIAYPPNSYQSVVRVSCSAVVQLNSGDVLGVWVKSRYNASDIGQATDEGWFSVTLLKEETA